MNTTEKKKKKEESWEKRAMKALALAGIERLGKESAANQVATNTFLLHDIADLLKQRREITQIMACGGITRFEGSKSVEMISVVTNEWSRGPDMPDPRWKHGMALVDDGRIFIIGGRVNGEDTNSVIALTVERETWKEMPPMSEKRRNPGVGVVDDKIFVFGGLDGEKCFNTCEVFSVKEDKWMTMKKVAPMPTARCDMGVAVIDRLIFAIGGWNNHALSKVEVLNTKENTWAILPPMPTSCFGMGVAVIDDRFIWTFGGSSSGDVDVIKVLDIETGEWTTPPIKMTSPRFSARAVAVGHKVFIIGGSGPEGGAMNLVEMLDVDTMTWSTVPPMIFSRWFHTASCV